MSVRIINLESIASLQSGDFIVVDNEDSGTHKYDVTQLNESMSANVASVYNANATYSVGQYCIYNDNLYKCITTISSPEVWNSAHWTQVTVGEVLYTKVDKISGKGLSENDFTDTYKTKLDGIASGAEVNVQADWSEDDSSQDSYIQNKPTSDTTLAISGGFADAKTVGDIFENIKSGEEQYAEYHLGFYLDENGDLNQVDDDE